MGAIIYGENFMVRGQFSSRAINQTAIFLGGNYSRGQFSGEQLSGGHSSRGQSSGGQLSGGHSSRGQSSGGQLSGGQFSSGAIILEPSRGVL